MRKNAHKTSMECNICASWREPNQQTTCEQKVLDRRQLERSIDKMGDRAIDGRNIPKQGPSRSSGNETEARRSVQKRLLAFKRQRYPENRTHWAEPNQSKGSCAFAVSFFFFYLLHLFSRSCMCECVTIPKDCVHF